MSFTQFQIILYVVNQQKSRDFYAAILQQDPQLDVPGMTQFMLMPNLLLGLMPNDGIASILGDKMPHPGLGKGIPRCELYLLTDNIAQKYNNALQAGAKAISPPQDRDWGDTAAYLADFDGHIIAFAQQL